MLSKPECRVQRMLCLYIDSYYVFWIMSRRCIVGCTVPGASHSCTAHFPRDGTGWKWGWGLSRAPRFGATTCSLYYGGRTGPNRAGTAGSPPTLSTDLRSLEKVPCTIAISALIDICQYILCILNSFRRKLELSREDVYYFGTFNVCSLAYFPPVAHTEAPWNHWDSDTWTRQWHFVCKSLRSDMDCSDRDPPSGYKLGLSNSQLNHHTRKNFIFQNVGYRWIQADRNIQTCSHAEYRIRGDRDW